MDFLKSAITFSVAAVVSLFVIDYVQEQRIQEKAKADAAYATKLKGLDDFRMATVQYDSAADAAFADLFEWSTRQKTDGMVRYEQEAFPRWLAAVETASHMFPKQADDISKLFELARKRHAIYDKLVDERLDFKESVKAIDPWAVRPNFRSLSDELKKSRRDLVETLQAVVFPVERE
jgi:hypothetical protein